MNRRSQTNLIIILAMVVSLFWAMMNQFYYTSSVGLSTTIRKELSESMFDAERARILYDQERKYALDRAILFTGLYGGNATDACGYVWVNETFPFLPVPELYLERPKIRYWKQDDTSCIPSEDQMVDTTNNIIRDYFSFAKISSLALSGQLDSEIELTVTRPNENVDTFTGTLDQPYLRDTYDLEYREYEEEVSPGVIVYHQEVYVLGQKYGIEVLADMGEQMVLENIWFDLRGIQPLAISLDDRPFTNPVTERRNKAGCWLLDDNYYLFASNYTPATGKYQFYVFDDGVACYSDPREYGDPICSLPEDPFCEPTDSDHIITLTAVGDVLDLGGQDEYVVSAIDTTEGNFISIQPLNSRNLRIGKDWVYYSPQLNAYEFADLKIGELSTEKGEITYTFIPSEDERLCFTISDRKYEIDNCVSLLSKTTYSGGFADLFSYAKEYLEGAYGEFNGWQRYELDHRLDYILDSVTMKTLKVFDGGSVIPKQDWKSRLIWNLGLEGTEYTYADHDCAKRYVGGGPSDGVEVFDCSLCPDTCDDLLNASIIAEFKREFEQITPTKLEYLTSYPWAIKVKEFQVTVTDKCSMESFSTSYSQSYEFDDSGESQVVGIPLQLLFGYEDSVTIESPYSGCPCSEDPNIIGVACDLNLDCNCGVNPNVGELECSPKGTCCPGGYEDVDDYLWKTAVFDESLEIEGELYPCCVRVIDGGCSGVSTYYCYKKDNTVAEKIEVTESCEPLIGRLYSGLRRWFEP